MKLDKLNYYAYDISEDEMGLLNQFFKLLNKQNKNFKGKAKVLDLLNFAKIPKAWTSNEEIDEAMEDREDLAYKLKTIFKA